MIYTLEITLQNRKPLNQRVVEISDNQNFETLAGIICELYGFSGEHLWEFKKDDELIINHPEYRIQNAELTMQSEDGDIENFDDEEFGDLQGIAKDVSSSSYLLSDYFSSNTTVLFIYDFGENWRFDVRFTQAKEGKSDKRKVVSGTGTYLIEDSGGPTGLKEYIDQYVHQKRDGDRWETYEDFSEWIQPAMRKFDVKNHTPAEN